MRLPREPIGIRFVESVGRWAISLATGVGALVMMVFRMTAALPRLFRHPRLFFEQADRIGVGSIPLVLLASLFTGAVSAAQAGYQIRDYAPLSLVGAAVGKAVILELAPVLTALVVAARVSTSIAAELGTMRVTEQVDALEVMAIDPIWYLAAPRFFAGLLMTPILVLLATLVAILGGYVVCYATLGLSTATYFNGVQAFFLTWDVVINQTKAFIFGGILTISGVFFGYRTSGGAEGVGRATIDAIVTACVLILMFDYIVATVMM
jgi:phospholipid/cholesterol/gamma-HCH transport system permease protein